jgi:hypothetical protein
MGRTRVGTYGRTDGRTDGRTTRRLYAPPKFFGEHNKNKGIHKSSNTSHVSCAKIINI